MITFFTDFPGTGKSHRAAERLLDRALRGEWCMYVAPSHRVLVEMRRRLLRLAAERGVPLEIVDDKGKAIALVAHKISRLEEVELGQEDGDLSPACHPSERKHLRVLSQRVGGIKIGRYCAKDCERAEGCAAKEFAAVNEARLANARIVLVTAAGFAGEWDPGERRRLIVDDVASYFELINVDSHPLAQIRSDKLLKNISRDAREAAGEIARAWFEGREPGEFASVTGENVSVSVWLASHADVDAIEHLGPQHEKYTDAGLARAVRDVIRLAASGWKPTAGERVKVIRNAPLKSKLLEAADTADAEWLDATPATKVLDRLGVKYETRCDASYPAETAQALRVLRCAGEEDGFTRTGLGPLTRMKWNGQRFDELRPEDVPPGMVGVPWTRVFGFASGSDLFITHKPIIDALLETCGDDGERLSTDFVEGRDVADLAPAELENLEALLALRAALGDTPEERARRVAWFGNLRSRNDWEHVESVRVLGTPWVPGSMLEAIGFEPGSDEFWAARRELAAGELVQAVERCRSARREELERAVSIVVEADLAPAGEEWTPSKPKGRRIDVSSSQCHHVTRASTEKALAGTVEIALWVWGEGVLPEIAADVGMTVKSFKRCRFKGAFPAQHEAALARWSPESIELAEAYERDVAAGADHPLPGQDELRERLDRWCGRAGVGAVAERLGVFKGTVSKMRRHAKIGEGAAKIIVEAAP
jgi:hypothetical protein